MHVMQHSRPRRLQRRMYLPSERQVVNGVGLGEVDGMFNIGKMFTRMFTFTPSSFKLKNIAGAIGSAVMTVGSGGLANIASEIAGPSGLKLTKGSVTGARSDVSKIVGYGTMAAAAAAGAYFGGSALLSPSTTAVGTAASGSKIIGTALGTGAATTGGGFLSTAGSMLSTVGSGIMSVGSGLLKALPLLGGIMGGGGGQQQQQGGMTQAEYDAQQRAAYEAGQQQAAYDAQVRAQQAQLYTPGGIPISYMPETGQPSMTGMNASYGDLRSPYTGITQDGEQVQIDPATGQVISEGMSMPMMIGIGGAAVLAGWYLLTPSTKSNN
jgi:hypothetical protein